MRSKLLSHLPGIRWSPSDIASDEPASKPKEKPRYVFALRSTPPPGSGASSNHERGGLKGLGGGKARPRQSQRTISITSQPDPIIDARTHAQGQSVFFARLPLELRTLVYEYVMGAETIHLTMASKKKIGHFLCEEAVQASSSSSSGGGVGARAEHDGDDVQRECTCRILVSGRDSQHVNPAALKLLRTCRRM